jgi:hypothetical protein
MDISVIARFEALDRLCESLTKQQIEDLQIVIKNTKEELEICENCGDSWVGNTERTLEMLANSLNFQPDYPEYDY